jgi:hypothetical protein
MSGATLRTASPFLDEQIVVLNPRGSRRAPAKNCFVLTETMSNWRDVGRKPAHEQPCDYPKVFALRPIWGLQLF